MQLLLGTAGVTPLCVGDRDALWNETTPHTPSNLVDVEGLRNSMASRGGPIWVFTCLATPTVHAISYRGREADQPDKIRLTSPTRLICANSSEKSVLCVKASNWHRLHSPSVLG